MATFKELKAQMEALAEKAEAAEQKENPDCALHKKHISFTPSESERIDLTGQSLKNSLERHIGNDLHLYMEYKQVALKKLGFGPAPIQVITSFNGVSEGDLLDAFLGLKSEIPGTRVQVSETRFDITISEPEAVATVRFEPQPSDSCVISYRATPLDLPVVLRCDVIRAPRIGKLLKIRLRSEVFDLLLETTGRGIDAHFTFHPVSARCTPSKWKDYWRFLAGIFSNTGEVEIRLDSGSQPLTFPVKMKKMPDRNRILDEASQFERAFSALSDLCLRAGIVPEPSFSGDAVIAHWRAITVFQALATGVQPEIRCIGNSELELLKSRPDTIIVASSLSLGGVRFALHGLTSVCFDSVSQQPSLRDFQFRKLCSITDGDAAFHEYIDTLRKREKIDTVLYL